MEDWKDIDGHPGYQINSDGRVMSRTFANTDIPGLLKPHIDKGGYLRLNIRRKSLTIHRLLAKAFLPNPQNHPDIDHINRNRLDNRLENLRWVPKTLQNLNRRFPPNASTGETNIHLCKGWYQVSIKRNGKYIFNKFFKTLEEAVEARNNFLKIISKEIV